MQGGTYLLGKRCDDLELSINIGGKSFKNPVMVASGTFGFAEEYASYMNINEIGAVHMVIHLQEYTNHTVGY